jgi:8-hydroxy-5-deazaflavin:NADPH oxidoreductase
MRIAVVGGTGREGRGLALRWARAGHRVTIGSRDEAKARARAEELSQSGFAIEGGSNEWAVREAEAVLLSVPYTAHGETLRSLREHLAGRILIDITVPLRPPRIREVHLPEGHSAALEAQAILGPTTPVVATLHHVSSASLADVDATTRFDVLVCSDDEAARETVIGLVGDLGFRGLDAGSLRNAVALESLTPVLMQLNKRYGGTAAGVRFVGVGSGSPS